MLAWRLRANVGEGWSAYDLDYPNLLVLGIPQKMIDEIKVLVESIIEEAWLEILRWETQLDGRCHPEDALDRQRGIRYVGVGSGRFKGEGGREGNGQKGWQEGEGQAGASQETRSCTAVVAISTEKTDKPDDPTT